MSGLSQFCVTSCLYLQYVLLIPVNLSRGRTSSILMSIRYSIYLGRQETPYFFVQPGCANLFCLSPCDVEQVSKILNSSLSTMVCCAVAQNRLLWKGLTLIGTPLARWRRCPASWVYSIAPGCQILYQYSII
ncbi:hypothetical protein GGR57DRAFT_234263 [Xylariaceae sp. FL1272]|nr:hypothetical protein GGR57DRAFT_234263 [Xylariaceae sp. FL1272]